MSDPIRYSLSAFKDAATCPARLHYKNLVWNKEATEDISYPTVTGSAVHHAIEQRLKSLIDDPYKSAEDYFQENLLDKFDASLLDRKEVQARREQMRRCIKNFEDAFYVPLMNSLTDPEHQVEIGLEIPWRKGVLKGKIDVSMEGIMSDWKTGMKAPRSTDLLWDQQSLMYYYLAQKLGMTVPEVFNYVYLYGDNVAKKEHVLESGPRKGQTIFVKNEDDPIWKYTYEVYPTQQRVDSMIRNWAIPLAHVIEQKIVYKNKSAFNCNSCKYRTVCDQTDLPAMSEAEHVDLIQELGSHDAKQG